LLLKGKGEYDADGSSVLVPGAPPKGSLASAKVGTEGSKQNENNAQAGERGQRALTEKDKREGKGSIKDDLARIDSQRRGLSTELADVRAQEAAMTKSFDTTPQAKDGIAARRKTLEGQFKTLNDRYDALDARLAAQGGGTTPPAAKPASPASKDTFVTGKTYKDSKGNRAKYLGNNKWEPV